jgi:hypothetical protein
VAAVVQPVAKRLSRMEDLLIEMRCEQDIQLKRLHALASRLETLTEALSGRAKPKGTEPHKRSLPAASDSLLLH